MNSQSLLMGGNYGGEEFTSELLPKMIEEILERAADTAVIIWRAQNDDIRSDYLLLKFRVIVFTPNGIRIEKWQGIDEKIQRVDFAAVCRQVVGEVVDRHTGDRFFMEAPHDQKNIARTVCHGAEANRRAWPSRTLTSEMAIVCRLFALFALMTASGCVMTDSPVMPKPSWLQRAWVPKPSRLAKREDRVTFKQVASYRRYEGKHGLKEKIRLIREGDLIAASLGKLESGKDLVFRRRLNYIAYTVLDYGHLDLVVQDPAGSGELVLFTCTTKEGVNTQRRLLDLGNRDWDVYRINDWQRVDRDRLYEFIEVGLKRGQNDQTYDNFSAVGFRNANLKPENKGDIGGGYICSTVVAAALHYAGVELDNTRNSAYVDLVSPQQVVTSQGRFFRHKERLANSSD